MKQWKAKEEILNMILGLIRSPIAMVVNHSILLANAERKRLEPFLCVAHPAIPAALKVMDPELQLYPFHVAAACAGNERTNWLCVRVAGAAPDLLDFKPIAYFHMIPMVHYL
jgi:hypothetical protein